MNAPCGALWSRLLALRPLLLPGQALAGAAVALMYSGGSVLEDFAVVHAERNLRMLIDRAPQ